MFSSFREDFVTEVKMFVCRYNGNMILTNNNGLDLGIIRTKYEVPPLLAVSEKKKKM